jgi:hypothetical protein
LGLVIIDFGVVGGCTPRAPLSCAEEKMEKLCRSCKVTKPSSLFPKDRTRSDGLFSYCKECNTKNACKWQSDNKNRHNLNNQRWAARNKDNGREKSARYKASKRSATPPWFDKSSVDLVYKKAIELGLEVDHIVPINSANVCGLHVWENLQLLDGTLNKTKGNRYWPDSWFQDSERS